MSEKSRQSSRQKFPLRTLEFANPTRLVNFLLTAIDEPELGVSTSVYENCLNRLFLVRPATLYIRVQSHADVISRVESMAQAGVAEATIHTGDAVPPDVTELAIPDLLRMIRLRRTRRERYRGGHVLAALWKAEPHDLSDYISHLWNLGATGLEIAFLRSRGDGSVPTHLIRIHGVRHPDAFQAWQTSGSATVELYSALTSAHEATPYYVSWGLEYPVPGVERLAQLDAGLVLIRQTSKGGAPDWMVFGRGDVHFFRKPYEVVDLKMEFTSQNLVESDSDAEDRIVPLELAIVQRDRAMIQQFWKLDREIDQLRRSLRDLEINRAKLVGRQQDEVFFAYRFDQGSSRHLNPMLVRLLQQRMGTLSGYDHAWCQPDGSQPFHLVMANRPSRTLGFSLQTADRVYYQPRQWRSWGVNLFLPLDTELAPLIDSGDAIPLLQRILERTAQISDGETRAGEGDYREWDAILWEPALDGRIQETRVKDKQPLLSKFRLLNSFQCQVARDVDEATRKRLAQSVREARDEVTDELDQLERELLEGVSERTTKIEARFEEMQHQLTRADGLVTQLEPKVEHVTAELLKAPDDWSQFVRRVIDVHRQINQPALEGFSEFTAAVNRIEVSLLKTMTPRARNLVEAAQHQRSVMEKRLQQFDETRAEAVTLIEKLEELGTRIVVVLAEVTQTHQKIASRVRKVEKARRQIETFRTEIDEIDKREKEVEQKLSQMTELRNEAEARDTVTRQREQEIQTQEKALSQQIAELSRLQLQLHDRGRQVAARLKKMSEQIALVRGHSNEVDQLSAELKQQIGFMDAHESAVQSWRSHHASWNEQLDIKGKRISQQLSEMQTLITGTGERDSALGSLQTEVQSLQDRLVSSLKRDEGNGHA